MAQTKIEWCDMTVNPVVGCTYGCDYCYARKMNKRFGWIEDFSEPQFFHERLQKLYTKKPKIIFINSMSDIADWNSVWLMETFVAIQSNPQNTYLALTKRPYGLADGVYENKPSNLWIGQTITCQADADICPEVYFLSIEPLLGYIDLKLQGTDVSWVIIGAETGNRKDKVVPESRWANRIFTACHDFYNTPVFLKDSMRGTNALVKEYPDYILQRHSDKKNWYWAMHD